ncbi:MAG: TIGR03960 family B12-binding radical SAM protein [Pseudomonadota bacterium]
MSILEEKWFSRIERPSRYVGNEVNIIRKDPGKVEVSIALGFPDVYEVGMSHTGLKILYHILNHHDWLAAERAFCPWVDLEKELRDRGLPLATMESGRPLADFDIVGFSLQHELSFTNVLSMLDLSGIPFLSDERDQTLPLIIAGGPACFNPEPVAELFDAIVVGDGEEVALEICRRVREAKGQGHTGKDELLARLASIKGVYVPRFFKVSYTSKGTLRAIEPVLSGAGEVEKAIVPDIDKCQFPAPQVVPFTELVHDRLAIEISRGCTRGCRFCQAGMIYRPVRERSPDSVIENAERALRLTGFEEISLLSLSSGDYGCLGPLLKRLMDRLSGNKIAVSLPSLRIDSLDPSWYEEIKRVRKTGFTLAPEAGNDRLRRVINKALTNEDVLKTAQEVYEAGWNLIKLYFMIGLPSEEEGDLLDIVRLAKEVLKTSTGRGKRGNLNVSISTFVPKSHTPFMWQAQITLEESERRIGLLQDALKHTGVRVKWNDPKMSWLEGIFSRGDRKLTSALIEAWKMGARFDAWSEHFKRDLWIKAFQKTGLDPSFYLYRPRSMKEMLPWDHIRSGVSRQYLEEELGKSMEGQITPDCRRGCLGCGICDFKEVGPVTFQDWRSPPREEGPPMANLSAPIRKFRITFSKTGHTRHLSHLELVRLFVRTFKRAGLDILYSKGHHPMPKISFASALPVGTESLQETVDVQLYETIPPLLLIKRIREQLPPGIEVTMLEEVNAEGRAPKLRESHFEITIEGSTFDEGELAKFLQAEKFPVLKMKKKGEQVIDAKTLVKSISLRSPRQLSLALIHVPGPELRPLDIIEGIFHLRDQDMEGIKVLKTRQVL